MILYPRIGEAGSVNLRQILIISASVVVAGGIFLWARSMSNKPTAIVPVAAAPQMELVKVLVAKRDLALGDRIDPAALAWQDWPKSGLGPVFITQALTPKAIEDYTGAVVRQPMVTGEPVVSSKIVQAGKSSSIMAALVTPGMRASSVAITADAGVAGFILPDNRVDVLLTRSIAIQGAGQNTSRIVSSTILQNVRVLAIDQKVTQAKDQTAIIGTTATLELSPADAEKLETADNLGDISLALRGYSDAAGPTTSPANPPSMAQPVRVASNTNNATPNMQNQQPNMPIAQPPTVKIYRGGQ
jgi:pilus assembly protein CpaB